MPDAGEQGKVVTISIRSRGRAGIAGVSVPTASGGWALISDL